jgi:2-dehydro-3-deoxyphosphogluconate aldolase / (4S)-4-hydroxy-2-oxoglutarate aldolase
MIDFDELFGTERIMIVLRGLPPATTVELATLAWDMGIKLVEVPIGTPHQLPSLAATVEAGAERGRLTGAGTVVTERHVHDAASAGARYTVAPGFDAAVLDASLAAGLPHLPGVATPSEVHHARRAGCRWVKVFPAHTLGAAWFRALHGPFPDLRFVATGGITAESAPDYLDAGARIVALGTALTDPVQRTQLASLVHALGTA